MDRENVKRSKESRNLGQQTETHVVICGHVFFPLQSVVLNQTSNAASQKILAKQNNHDPPFFFLLNFQFWKAYIILTNHASTNTPMPIKH